jgi:hypothetical protein
MSLKRLNKHASQCQIEADETAFTLLKEREQNRMYWILQDYCDFNVIGLMLLGWHKDFIQFVIHNGSQLRRPFTFSEFMYHAQRYRIIRIKLEPKSFEDLKKIKIKKPSQPLP